MFVKLKINFDKCVIDLMGEKWPNRGVQKNAQKKKFKYLFLLRKCFRKIKIFLRKFNSVKVCSDHAD